MMNQEVMVEGIKCGGCAKTVIEKFTAIKGVESVSVDIEQKKVTVTTPSPIDKADFEAALADTKFSVQ